MKTKFKLNFFVKIYSDMNKFVSFAIMYAPHVKIQKFW